MPGEREGAFLREAAAVVKGDLTWDRLKANRGERKMSASSQRVTKLLNVGLELRTEGELEDFLAALGDKVRVTGREGENTSLFYAAIEFKEKCNSVDETVAMVLATVQALPLKIRAIWEGCVSRQVNIGIQAGVEPYDFQFDLSDKTAALLASMRCGLGVIVHSVEMAPV